MAIYNEHIGIHKIEEPKFEDVKYFSALLKYFKEYFLVVSCLAKII